MDLEITTYDKDGKATVLDLFGVQENDITIEVDDSGMHIRSSAGVEPTDPEPTSIPLVIYIAGERKVIGSANVVDDGNDFVVTATMDAAAAPLLASPPGQFSIGPSVESVSERLKREYGTPVATALSMGAWAKEVERVSGLDSKSP